MLSERMMTCAVHIAGKKYLHMKPCGDEVLPKPDPSGKYMLYIHIPFCESLCPYCSFNRYVFEPCAARSYFSALWKELAIIRDAGYDFESMYIGGGTPTVLPDRLAETIRLAKEYFHIRDVSAETNPNHLCAEYLDPVSGLVDRMSVGVQSFDDGLLKQMGRYEKYGSAQQILERIQRCAEEDRFRTLNVDMIFNFPSQTEEMLRRDLEMIRQSRCTQTTFYPLMAAPSVKQSLRTSLGEVSHRNEKRYYDIICDTLTGGKDADFTFGSVWSFNRKTTGPAMIDEYVVDYEEYLAAGSGGMSFMDRQLLINTFHLKEYAGRIESGRHSVSGAAHFNRRDLMRYRLMMQLFGMGLDLRRWKEDFGSTPAAGLPAEYIFLKLAGGIRTEGDMLRVTDRGRYLMAAMMREFFIGVNTLRDEAREQVKKSEKTE